LSASLKRAPAPATSSRPAPPAPPERAQEPAIPLGGLPPLPLADGRAPPVGHAFPVQAVTALVLAAAVGTTLLGTALTASIQGKLREAEAAVVAVPAVSSRERAGRGDALVARHLKPVEDRRTFSATFTQTVNGQDVIRTARFEKLSSRLATVADETGGGVPATLLDEVLRPGGKGQAAEDALAAGASSEDAEVLVSHRPLYPAAESGAAEGDAADHGEAVLSDALAAEEVLAYERGENARFSWLGAGGPLSLGTAAGVPGETDLTPEDSFSRMSVQFIPENVTVRSRASRPDPNVQRVVMDGSQTLQEILVGKGLTITEAEQVSQIARAAGIQQGRTLELELAPPPAQGLVRLSADFGAEMAAVVARTDTGRFVPVELPQAPGTTKGRDEEEQTDEGEEGVPLYQTLYLSARNAGMSHEATLDLIRLFASDFDLEQGTTQRDVLEVLALEGADEKSPGTMLSVQLTSAGKTRRYYRALDGKSGDLAYVDAEGRSFHSALDTKPVIHARLTSKFGGRYHPILHYTRPHNGIDWAAKIGTPIMAAGDGEVTEAGVHSGYGRHVEIRHADGYVTTYSHMDRIARDVTVGKRVSRGDVIGFLGQSGLATGPHLHFEYKLNGIFVDPLTVKVPRARLTQRDAGSRFAAWVQQIDRLAACETCEASH
jgi:murein DD-endopeptidase MepM/ murein hydrolase activator NlpD